MAVKSGAIIRIGTRGSPLALRQVEMVKAALAKAQPGLETLVVQIKTSGDWDSEKGETRLADTGGKGQFAKEIEAALLAGEIDCGVHSMKDMESDLPEGLVIDHMLSREDPRDAFLSRDKMRSDELPIGASVGSSSLRRQSFLLAQRPDLKVVPLRGNVQTRIQKMKVGQVDATMLAYAGLKRLGLEKEIAEVFEIDVMLPSAGQGAIGIECRADDKNMLSIIGQISDLKTVICVSSERGALAALGGTCHTPVGAHAVLEDGQLRLIVKVASPDGKNIYGNEVSGKVTTADEARAMGLELGGALKKVIPKGLLS
jgi:hydroxymethylbilane synthase